MNCDLAYEVLRIFALADCRDELFWTAQPEKGMKFFAQCSDVFWWATADLEEITEEDLSLLKQCYQDLKPIDMRHYLPELYAARKRGLRPQGAWYGVAARIDHEGLAELFDAAGPPREADILNPKGR